MRAESGKALFVGDVSLDLTILADHLPVPDEKVHVDDLFESAGGVITNAAVACARTGIPVRAFVAMGNDDAAAVLTSKLQSLDIDVTMETLAGRTCRVVIIVEPHGEKRLLLDPGVAMYPSVAAIETADLEGTTWVHTAVYGDGARALIERCRSAGIRWSLDLEPATFRHGIDALRPMIDGAAVIFCNDRAARALGDDAASFLLGIGACSVVRTCGSAGARFLGPGADFSIVAPSIGQAVDTTGAGDCLAGWFIGETLCGADEKHALRSAVIAATLSCQKLGAQDAYPTKNDVAAYGAKADRLAELIKKDRET